MRRSRVPIAEKRQTITRRSKSENYWTKHNKEELFSEHVRHKKFKSEQDERRC